jgi:hypothetical protein
LDADEGDEEQKLLEGALQSAITKSSPFKFVPNFKEPVLKFIVKLSGNKIKLEKATAATTL